MSQYMIDVDDTALQEQVRAIIETIFEREMRHKYYGCGSVIAEAVKDLIYSNKDEIIEKVVDRAAKEIVKKALPKLIERMEEGEKSDERKR